MLDDGTCLKREQIKKNYKKQQQQKQQITNKQIKIIKNLNNPTFYSWEKLLINTYAYFCNISTYLNCNTELQY